MNECITFVTAVNNEEVYKNNFLASKIFSGDHGHEILVQQNYPSAAKAFNDAIDKAKNDLMIFVHQDVVFPESWLGDLEKTLDYLADKDPLWGVLGSSGKTRDGQGVEYLYCAANRRILGKKFEHPVPVQTLDEVILILRKSSGLRFNSMLPHFHFYGTDICLEALDKGKTPYAISAFFLHNGNKTVLFPKEFFECANHIARRWRNYLPIHTSCIEVTNSMIARYVKYKYIRKIRYFYSTILGRAMQGGRIKDPISFLRKLENEIRMGEMG